VRKNPSYKEQIIVTLEGEVMYPGQYTLISKTEKLSDLIARAGGLKSSAYPKGAVLLRNTFETVTDASLLENKLNMLGVKSKDSSATETLQNSLIQGQKLVGIRLDEVIQTPGSVFDLQLQQGDIIKVPRQLQTVQAFGGIFISKKVVYREGLTFRQVINESGGFSGNALKRRSYVVYPNGEVRSTKKFLFFNNFPEIKPGSEVYIPLKDQGRRVNSQEIISYTTALVSVAAMVFGIINITK
jgi:protein involved in polysaccharide export with SLBB domain